MSWELLLLLPLGGFIFWWMASLKTREIAVQAGKQACRERGLQFLDDTVVHAKTVLKRNDEGTLTFLRIYRFEFSDTGDNRRDGDVTLLGNKVEWLRVGEEMMEGGNKLHSLSSRLN
ncbi:MAG: DUF3301 domain-containing protein [Thiobacillaceae bacterium]|jgi:hypothetical protein